MEKYTICLRNAEVPEKRKTHTTLSRNTKRGVFLRVTRLWGSAPNPGLRITGEIGVDKHPYFTYDQVIINQ